jgi:hypothetical protein
VNFANLIHVAGKDHLRCRPNAVTVHLPLAATMRVVSDQQTRQASMHQAEQDTRQYTVA